MLAEASNRHHNAPSYTPVHERVRDSTAELADMAVGSEEGSGVVHHDRSGYSHLPGRLPDTTEDAPLLALSLIHISEPRDS